MGLPSQVTVFSVPTDYGGRTSSEAPTHINGSTYVQQKKFFQLANSETGKTVYREAGVAPSRASTIELLSSSLKSGDIRRVVKVTQNRNVYDANGTVVAQKRPVVAQVVIDIPSDMVWGDPSVPSGASILLSLLQAARGTTTWPTADATMDGVTVQTLAERTAFYDLAAAMRYWLTGDLLR